MVPLKAIGAAAAAISMSILSIFLCKSLYNLSMRKHQRPISKTKARKGLIDCIGNTPLIRINSVSDATGCEILAKAEFLNPGGSVKGRVAVKIIEEVSFVEWRAIRREFFSHELRRSHEGCRVIGTQAHHRDNPVGQWDEAFE